MRQLIARDFFETGLKKNVNFKILLLTFLNPIMMRTLTRLFFVVSVILFTACNSKGDESALVPKADSLASNAQNDPHHLLTGKWNYTRIGSQNKPNYLFVIFKANNTASLHGPDSEFERIKWRFDDKLGLIITGLKKSDDSGWTFRDSVYKYVFSNGNRSLSLTGKRQSFTLKRL
jgi:hypothetical protein